MWAADYFDNVMKKFFSFNNRINRRTDEKLTSSCFFYNNKLSNCLLSLFATSHNIVNSCKFIDNENWARENFARRKDEQ